MMKWIDPTIELAACGSSSRNMPTFGAWEDTVLEHTFDHVEYISLHTYLNNYAGDTAAFLASPDLMDSFIDEVVAIADAVAARRRSSKRIMLSFDEWNVWYRTRAQARRRGSSRAGRWRRRSWRRSTRWRTRWPSAAPASRCSTTPTGSRSACLAQLVNAIAPIMTETGGPAWRQTIFYPFAQMSNLGRGRVLRAQVDSPTYAARYYDPRGAAGTCFPLPAVPYLKLVGGPRRGGRHAHPVRAQPQPERGDAAAGRTPGLRRA